MRRAGAVKVVTQGLFGGLLRSDPTPHHVRIQAVVQRHRCNRHIRLHRRTHHLRLEILAMSSTPRRLHYILDYLGLFHRVHVSMPDVDRHDPRSQYSPNQGVFAGRLRFIEPTVLPEREQ